MRAPHARWASSHKPSRAAPLTGCVLRSPAEVDVLDDEREGAGWERDTVAWCVGPETAARARERGWREVRQAETGQDWARLVDWLAAERRPPS